MQNIYPLCMNCSIYFDIALKQEHEWKFIEEDFHIFWILLFIEVCEEENFEDFLKILL